MQRYAHAGTSSRRLRIRLWCSAFVALGAVSLIGCSDDEGTPTDAPPPVDAPQADAPQAPPDAPRTPVDAAPIDAALVDANLPNRCDSLVDILEPNDTAGTAANVDPGDTSEDPEWVFGEWDINACVRGTNEDWYRLPSSQVRWDLAEDGYDGRPHIRLRFVAEGAHVCSHIEGCKVPSLPEAPMNTVTVEVYHAATMTMLMTQTSMSGQVRIDGRNEQLEEDILVRVVGPQEALYAYRLYAFIDSQNAEDECEC